MAIMALLAILLIGEGETEADTIRYAGPSLGRSMLPRSDPKPSAHPFFNSDLRRLTQPLAQRTDERDSRRGEHGGAMQEEEPEEITIYISGEYKAVAAALLDAVDEGTPMTGIADFDALSSTYGLMGIHRKGRRFSGFYGHRFRLTFPPAADVASIAGAYWNLPYVKSTKPEPPLDARIRQADDQDEGLLMRVTDILIVGGLMYGIYKLINQPWGWGE